MRGLALTDPAFLADLATPLAPPSLVQEAGNHANSTSATATLGVAATAGNVLVACLAGSASSGTITLNTPAGYTLLGAIGFDSTNIAKVGVYMKTAAGGETGLTATTTGTAPFTNLQLMEFTPTGLAIAQDATIATAKSSSATSLATGSFGPFAQPNEIVVVASCAFLNITGSEAITGGFAELSHLHRASTQNVLVAGYLIPSATTALNPTLSWAGTANKCCAVGVSIK